MSFRRDFDDATFRAITFDLPIFDRSLFTADRRHSANPENAGTKAMLCGAVIDEQQSGFTNERSHIEIIIHDHENVHIVGFMFVGDKRSKDDKTYQMASLRRDSIDAFEASRNECAAVRACSKAGHSFGK